MTRLPFSFFSKNDNVTICIITIKSILYPISFCSEDKFKIIFFGKLIRLIIIPLPTMFYTLYNLMP